MNRSTRLLTPALTAALLAAAGPASPVTAQDTIRTADYDVRDLEYPPLHDFEVPEPERVELENGMVIFLLEDHELPQIKAVARIGTGSVYEPAEKVGLASVSGTVMRTGGTASMSPDSLNQVLEGLGATVETSIGSTGGTAFMSTLKENVDTVLPIFAEVIRQPAFAEEKVELAKSQRKSSISRRNDNPQQIAFREFDKILYGEKNPYARHTQYWTIDAITRQDVVDFHDEYFHPNNVILSVWGDFETGPMKERLRAAFGDWARAEDFSRPMPPEPTARSEHSVNFIQKDDVTQSTILMGHPGKLERDDPDHPAVVVMNEVLSGGFSGRLFQNVRKEKGLAYWVFGDYTAHYSRPGRFFAGVFSKSATTVEATEAVLREVERMREAPPSQVELQVAKDSYLNSFVFNFDTKREILSRLMSYEYYGYPSDFLEQLKDRIEEVSAGDVLRVSKDYLYPEASRILVVGRRQDFSQELSTLAKGEGLREIDVSIPTSPPGEAEAAPEASGEELAGGREKLMAAREALGGSAFGDLRNLKLEAETNRKTPQGSLSIPSATVVAMDGKIRAEQTLPNGMSITLADDGERMMMKGPRGTQSAPSQLQEQLTRDLWRNLVYLMANLDREGLEAQDLGTKEIEGTEYEAVKVTPPEGEAYTLYLDPKSMRPVRARYTALSPQGPTEAVDVYGDYREVSGLTVPFEIVTYQGREEASRTTRSQVQINVELEEGYFTLEGGP